MNRLHAMTIIQREALEGGDIDPKTIYGKVRGRIETSGDKALMSRGQLEAFAAQSIEQVQRINFPVERRRLELDILEGELKADLLDRIAALDISNPRDARDVFKLHQQVGSSTGEPTLREAISMLEAGGQDVADLTARVDAIYPPAAEE